MKRLVVIIILLFPILTLLFWVYWGFTRPRPAQNPPAAATNLNSSTISNQP